MTTIEFLRQFRIGEYAIFDFAISFIGMALLSPLLSKLFLKFHIKIPKLNWIFLTIPLSILIHILVGNITPLTKNFLDIHDHYILKVVVIALLVYGLKNIKRIKAAK